MIVSSQSSGKREEARSFEPRLFNKLFLQMNYFTRAMLCSTLFSFDRTSWAWRSTIFRRNTYPGPRPVTLTGRWTLNPRFPVSQDTINCRFNNITTRLVDLDFSHFGNDLVTNLILTSCLMIHALREHLYLGNVVSHTVLLRQFSPCRVFHRLSEEYTPGFVSGNLHRSLNNDSKIPNL